MNVKPLKAEQALTNTANTISNGTVVRIYNDSGSDALITNFTTSATFTLRNGTVAHMVKAPTDTLKAVPSVKATSVGHAG